MSIYRFISPCDIFFDVAITENDRLSHFSFENFVIQAKNNAFDCSMISGVKLKNVKVNQQQIE